MLSAVSLTLALASFAAAAPIANLDAVMAAVDVSLKLPNTTQTNNATYYYQNGNAGACGLYSQDTDVVVGLPLEFYSNTGSVSPYCGSYVVVRNVNNNETVTARVADASASNEILSVSIATYKALDGAASDMNTVTWRFANETEVAEAEAALSDSSAPSSTSAKAYVAPTTTTQAYVAPSSSSPAYVAETTTVKAYVAPATTQAYVAPSSSSPAYVAPTTTTQAYVAPTTTTQAYVAPTKQASSSSGSGSYSGQATYFFQNGVAGACGAVNSDSSYIVALDSAMYDGGAHCGQTVSITGNGVTIQAKVADECPTCASSGSLDLSHAAFNALASDSAGVVAITWSWA